MLNCLINNNYREWEQQLSAAMTAYRNATSVVTGYTPFFLLYGRRGRLPLVRSFSAASGLAHQSRLYELARALTHARQMTAQSHQYNRQRINARATEGEVKVGDTVVVKVHNRLTFTSKWDPQYEVYNVREPVVSLRNQQTGKTRVINKSKIIVVDPDIIWDDINSRPRKVQKQVPLVSLNEEEQEVDDNEENEETQEVPEPTQIERTEFLQATANLPPSASTRAVFKRHRTGTDNSDAKRPRLVSSKRKLEAPSWVDQKRQRVEAIELASLYYSL